MTVRPVIALVVAIVTLAALVAGICSRSAPTPTPQATPTPVPSRVAGEETASVTAVSTQPIRPGSTATATAISIRIAIPACKASPPGTFVGGAGTIPGPTPTEVPTPAPRTVEESRAAFASYGQRMQPILDAGLSWLSRTQDRWPGASARDHAGLVVVESSRMAVLCTATASVDVDFELRAAHTGWVDAITARQAWTSEVANSLACCGLADSPALEARRVTTAAAIESAARTLREQLIKYGPQETRSEYSVSSERLELELSVPSGWVVVRNDTQVAVIAESSMQLDTPEGLGPDESDLGTSVRIRRLRKASDWTLDAAADQARGALAGLGSERSRRMLTVDGSQGIELLLAHTTGDWLTRLVVVGAGDHAYFIELGCPETFDRRCAVDFDRILGGLDLGAGRG